MTNMKITERMLENKIHYKASMAQEKEYLQN